LPVDILEFFILTPLPGSEDHKRLVEQGADLDRDMNNYDLQHVVMDHPKMSRRELAAIYREAWDIYYSEQHVTTLLRRARAWGYSSKFMMQKLFAFYAPLVYERMHPLEGGLVRRKYRRDRRPGLPIESPLTFYMTQAKEYAAKYIGVYGLHKRFKQILAQVDAEPNPEAFMDTATTPVRLGEELHLDLLSTGAAQAFIAQRKNIEARRSKAKETRPS